MVTIRLGSEEMDLSWDQWEMRVRAGRIPPDTLVRFEPITGDEFVVARDLEIYQSVRDLNIQEFKDTLRMGKVPIATVLLVGVQIRIWWLIWCSDAFEPILLCYLSPSAVMEDGEVWRLLTMGLLHASPGHILSNMVVLLYVGWNLERALGRLNIVTIYFASVACGSLFSIFMTPETPSLGASGGVLGMVAAASVFGFVRMNVLTDRAQRVFGWAIFPYLVAMFMMGWLDSSVDNWAHLGGLLGGGFLALFLAPPALQKSPRSNRFGAAACAFLFASICAVLWTFGPSFVQLHDAAKAFRKDNTDGAMTEVYRPFVWLVPVGWTQATGSNNMSIYISPSDPERSWGVQLKKRGRPSSVQEVFQEWDNHWKETYPNSLELVDSKEELVHGQPGMVVTWRAGSPETSQIEMRLVSRGLYVFAELWQVQLSDANRLRPLRDRLRASNIWKEPKLLQNAREMVERRPNKRAAQTKLGNALLEFGEIKEAIDVWKHVIDQHPEQPDGWIGMLQTLAWYPEDVPEHEALWTDILSRNPLPAVLAQLAISMDAVGERYLARAILEIYWRRAPGERNVGKARQRLGLPTAMLDGLPSDWLWDSNTGLLRKGPTPTLQRDDAPIQMEAVREEAQTLQANDIRWSSHLAHWGSTDPLKTTAILAFISTGTVPHKDRVSFVVDGLTEELRGVADGNPPPWLSPEMDKAMTALLQSEPDLFEQMSNHAAAIIVREDASALGTKVVVGISPESLLRREKVQFLAEASDVNLLERLGWRTAATETDSNRLNLLDTPRP